MNLYREAGRYVGSVFDKVTESWRPFACYYDDPDSQRWAFDKIKSTTAPFHQEHAFMIDQDTIGYAFEG